MSHRILHDLYEAPKLLADPGNGGTIRPNEDLQICELVSTGADETRVLANPTKPGVRLVIRMLTDGGDIVMSAENGLNTSLEVSATFADADDMLSLISVTKTAGSPPSAGTYRWQTLDGNIGVTLA